MKTNNTENSGQSEVQKQAVDHWKRANQSYRKTIEDIWKCGRALCDVRKELDRGKWVKWLESEDIPKTTAYRWMRFSKHCKESEIETIGSVNQALPPARRKRKEPDKEVEAGGKTEEEAPSVEKEEITDVDGTPRHSVEGESPQEIEALRNKLRETEDQLGATKKENVELRKTEEKLRKTEEKLRKTEQKLRKTEEELREANQKIAEFSETRKEVDDLRQENDRLRRLRKDKEIPSEPTSEKQIRPHSAFPVKGDNPESGGERTMAAP